MHYGDGDVWQDRQKFGSGGVHSLACLDRKRVLEFFSPLAVGGCKTASCFWFQAFDPVSSVQTKRRGFSRDLNP